MPGALPPTGTGTDTPIIIGVGFVVVGLGAIGYSTRRHSRRADNA
jgi:LPXTG-motif cell wall-anchored protein